VCTELLPFNTSLLVALSDEYCIALYVVVLDNILIESSDVPDPAYGAFFKRILCPGGKSPLWDIEIALAKRLKSVIGSCPFGVQFCHFRLGLCPLYIGICDILTYLTQFLKEAEAACVGSHFLLRAVLECLRLLDNFVDAGLGKGTFSLYSTELW
jgi:hypothetical protein